MSRCILFAHVKRLIVNADDLGRCPGVDAGIMSAHREGVVTSSTLMANSPDAEHAAGLARSTPSLDVGVHLVLTFARPLTDPARIPSLVESDGAFPSRPGPVYGRARADEVLVEYRAQYARARELLGRTPTHLDSHHFVHDDPEVGRALGELARETGAAARMQGDAHKAAYRALGVRTPDRFCREFQFSGNIDVPALEAILGRIAEAGDGTTELMCHPGEPDAELLAHSTYASERATEVATLTDPRTREAIARHGLELATFADL